jgi:hypothetical protein
MLRVLVLSMMMKARSFIGVPLRSFALEEWDVAHPLAPWIDAGVEYEEPTPPAVELGRSAHGELFVMETFDSLSHLANSKREHGRASELYVDALQEIATELVRLARELELPMNPGGRGFDPDEPLKPWR